MSLFVAPHGFNETFKKKVAFFLELVPHILLVSGLLLVLRFLFPHSVIVTLGDLIATFMGPAFRLIEA